MRTSIAIFMAFAFLWFVPTGHCGSYTLDDLYAIALERSERIKISEEDLAIARTGKDKARSALLPKVSGLGNYTGYKEQKVSDTGSLTQPDEASGWSLRLDHSVSMSGKEITAYRAARDNIKKTDLDLFAVKEQYILSVTNAYYDVLKASRLVEIQRQNVERLTKHRDAASVRLRIGEVTKTAVLRAEAELSGARSDLVKAQNLLKFTKAVLKRIVGLEDEFEIVDTHKGGTAGLRDISEGNTDPVIGNCPGLELECLRRVAHVERAEVKSSGIQKDIASSQVAIARGSYWPTLAVEGIFAQRKETPETSGLIRDNLYGGVKVVFPFFEGGLRAAEVMEAESKKRQTDYAYEDLRKTVTIEVESSYLDFVTQKGILRSLEDQWVFAEDNYKAVSKQFDFGLAQSVDVMDANTLLVTAERQLIDALYQYQQAVVRLKRSTGTLLASLNAKTAGPPGVVKENIAK
ncbi:MAG: Outer membrane protein TolC precursor [Syntrophorhabdus sp. PtaB.Bin047]|nr:MAG: Outer membrane protein TolC precursor [Syntrophorhabdus sp. PtaB.Bin047]